MEASCFLTSNSFSKNIDLAPVLKAKNSCLHKKSFRQSLHGKNISTSTPLIYCNLKPRPEDSKSDWRTFRARLVASEQANTIIVPPTTLIYNNIAQGPSCTILGQKWAHPLHEPEKGCLLIATEKLDGVHIFERTVILLLSTGPLGPTGIILNRPSLMSIKETRSTGFNVTEAFMGRPLFFGGPIGEGFFLVGPREGDEDKVAKSGVFEEVMEGVYYGTKESVGCAAEMVKRNMVGVDDFRFYDGYCGWEKEQLREEIRAGFWSVVACSSSVIELTRSTGKVGLWEEVLGLVGGRKVW